MKKETEVYLVMALDGMITKIDNVIEEIDEIDLKSVEKAKGQLINITMELNGLMDRLTEEGTNFPPSGAV